MRNVHFGLILLFLISTFMSCQNASLEIVKRKHRKGFHVDLSLRNKSNHHVARERPNANLINEAMCIKANSQSKDSKNVAVSEQVKAVINEKKGSRHHGVILSKALKELRRAKTESDISSLNPYREVNNVQGLKVEKSHFNALPDMSLPADPPDWVPWVGFVAGLGIIPMAFLAAPIAIVLCALALFFGFWGIRHTSFGPLATVGLVIGFIYLFYLIIIGIFMLSVYLAFL